MLRALPDAQAVALQSGWPTPISDVSYRDRTVGNVLIFGVTPPYQIVQDYRMLAGVPLTEPDVRERRPVAVIGYEVADKLFDQPAAAVGQEDSDRGPGGTGDGRDRQGKGACSASRSTRSCSCPSPPSSRSTAAGRRPWCRSRWRAPRRSSRPWSAPKRRCGSPIVCGPARTNDFTVDKADALVAFWNQLTRLLFTAIPAVVASGIVVGGIVIMNIMLMSVTRAHPGDRPAQVARGQPRATSAASS